jgi:glycosyltransferase involved in cell wall biosynthesis
MEEVIDHGRDGVLVPPENAEALAWALCELLSDRARLAEMGSAARDGLRPEWTARACSLAAQDVYRAVADG